jgi:hypothetical protein
MENLFDRVTVDSPAPALSAPTKANMVNILVGDADQFSAATPPDVSLDVARNRFTSCTFVVGDSGTSTGIALRFCDINTFYDCFVFPEYGNTNSVALRILPDMSAPGTSNTFPSGNGFYNTSLVGDIVVSSDWLPGPEKNNGLHFFPYNGEAASDYPFFSNGGIFGFTHTGEWLAPQIGVRWGSLINGVTRTVLARAMTLLQVINTTTETTLFTRQIPANLLQGYLPTGYGTRNKDRQLVMRIKGRYVNNSGGSETVTLRAKYGATTIMSAPIAITADANARTVIIDVSLSAKDDDAAKQASDSEIKVFAPIAVSGSAALIAAHYAAQHTGITENSATALSMTVTVQHTTASANIYFNLDSATLEML